MVIIIIITDIDYNGAEKINEGNTWEGEKAMNENENERKREKGKRECMHASENERERFKFR